MCSPTRSEYTKLALNAGYEPPLRKLGELIDLALVHRVGPGHDQGLPRAIGELAGAGLAFSAGSVVAWLLIAVSGVGLPAGQLQASRHRRHPS